MLLPTYTVPGTGTPQVTTSQSWWQGLFGLGQEAIRRALPLPGETAGGIPGVPSAYPGYYPGTTRPAQQGFQISQNLLIIAALTLGAAFFLPKILKRG